MCNDERRELWPCQDGGTFLKYEFGRGYKLFLSENIFGRFIFKTLYFFENYLPQDVINDRSLRGTNSKTTRYLLSFCLS